MFWICLIIVTTSDFIHHPKSSHKERNIKRKLNRICKCFKYIGYKIGLILSKKYMILMLKTIWNRNIMYYERLSQILSQGEYPLLFVISTQIFNLSFTNNYGQQSNYHHPWCFINGLNAKQKILINLLTPSIIIITIFILYLISKRTKVEK